MAAEAPAEAKAAAAAAPTAAAVAAPTGPDTKGERAIAAFKAKNPDILFLIARSKNLNVVVYEAMRGSDRALDSKKAIDVYWEDIDPTYVAANRKKGKMTDRDSLNVIEQKMAYGVKAEETTTKGRYRVTLVSLPSKEIFLELDPESRARCTMTIGGVAGCVLSRIYVHSVERTLLPPKVEYVEIFGTNPAGEAVSEKVVP